MGALARRLQPQESIERIRYFTARLKPLPGSPDSPKRQNVYLRALRADPTVEVHLGHFRADIGWQPVAAGPWSNATRPRLRPRWLIDLAQRAVQPRLDRPVLARVVKMEEKGSDVNLAAHLMNDVLTRGLERALVVSNDADLAEPIRLAATHGATVGVVNPHRRNQVSRHLRQVATFSLPLRHQVLAQCQLPPTVVDGRGREIHKPAAW